MPLPALLTDTNFVPGAYLVATTVVPRPALRRISIRVFCKTNGSSFVERPWRCYLFNGTVDRIDDDGWSLLRGVV